ncbi:phospholipase effector Tle1 domain-containing protein, partial [Henriciella pelagia]|uniref:phospholipase effector Tle1 domain-containing protein n=1 Tax=Henriciella pelagia TaxID=1977912 RepID=UPI003516F027
MKRIIILCDGTWNRSDSKTPTNVVQLAQAIEPIDPIGIVQVPIYIQGVGTGEGVTSVSRKLDALLGGAFG